MAYIRFFQAFFPLTEPLCLSIHGGCKKEFLGFGDLTEYLSCPSGFRQVTVTGSLTKTVYLQKTLPFFSPDCFTLAVIPGSLGIDLLQVPDYPCFPAADGFGCVRTVSLTDDPYCYHLFLYGRRLLFADVSFRHITARKQIKEGTHGVYLTHCQRQTPLIPSVFPLRNGESCTCYVYGSLRMDTLSLIKVKDTPDAL